MFSFLHFLLSQIISIMGSHCGNGKRFKKNHFDAFLRGLLKQIVSTAPFKLCFEILT